jgi:hypothetical protein
MMWIDLIYIQQNVFPKQKILAIEKKISSLFNKLYANQILIH